MLTFNQATIYFLVFVTLGFLAFFFQFILFTCFSGVVLSFFCFQEIKKIRHDIGLSERIQMLDQKIIALEIKNQSLSLAIGFKK